MLTSVDQPSFVYKFNRYGSFSRKQMMAWELIDNFDGAIAVHCWTFVQNTLVSCISFVVFDLINCSF